MRKGTGIAGATLLFGSRDKAPDLVQAMQYLLDDLRAEGRRIAAMKLTPSTLRLRADPYEMVLTVANAPLPTSAMQGLLRPPAGDAPDFPRVHLIRTLRHHHHAMGVLLRRRGAPIPDLDEAFESLADEGRFVLMSVVEAAAPSLVIWQPGGLVLSAEEFRHAGLDLLLHPGDPALPLAVPPPDAARLSRPGTSSRALVPLQPDESASRALRLAGASRGHLFGPGADRPTLVPRLDRASDRILAALRDPAPPAGARGRIAAALWGTILPALTGLGDAT